MKQYEAFVFDSYAFFPETGKIELRYALDDQVEFTETITLPPESELPQAAYDPAALDRALFALHLIGGISYYKTCCPKKIVIKSGKLGPKQAAFWNEVYESGLGEFFYQNNIDFRDLVRFPSVEDAPEEIDAKGPSGEMNEDRVLVPMGGGKDSVVTMELLRASGIEPTLFRMAGHPLIDALAGIARLPVISVKRALSPTLFLLNKKGALNGHVPITGYLSFLTAVIGILYGFGSVVMSNERSADVGSLLFYGKEINHQWSKGLRFERLFQQYLKTHVHAGLKHFSLLRPLSELNVVRLFSLFPEYLAFATSCNANWKILGKPGDAAPKWCGACPKCAFVFALLAAFIPKDQLVPVIGKNLFEDAALIPLYRQLLGIEGVKPFECVGTPEETQAAFLLVRKSGEYNDTPVMQMFLRDGLPHIADAQAVLDDTMMPSPDHLIPGGYSTVIPQIDSIAL
jgi:UDP-N-acetyl-alpha-D-muramoyl-L-alanyl-L-glutamate epimerase